MHFIRVNKGGKKKTLQCIPSEYIAARRSRVKKGELGGGKLRFPSHISQTPKKFWICRISRRWRSVNVMISCNPEINNSRETYLGSSCVYNLRHKKRLLVEPFQYLWYCPVLLGQNDHFVVEYFYCSTFYFESVFFACTVFDAQRSLLHG